MVFPVPEFLQDATKVKLMIKEDAHNSNMTSRTCRIKISAEFRLR